MAIPTRAALPYWPRPRSIQNTTPPFAPRPPTAWPTTPRRASICCCNWPAATPLARATGPDLTMIGHSQTRDHVLESILEPSKEIAPLFTLWTITTKSGQKIDGMLLRRDGQQKEVYVDSAGQEIKVAEPDVADRKIRT